MIENILILLFGASTILLVVKNHFLNKRLVEATDMLSNLEKKATALTAEKQELEEEISNDASGQVGRDEHGRFISKKKKDED